MKQRLDTLRIFLPLVLLTLSLSAQAGLDPKYFPVDEAMRVRVNFWKKVYTEIASHQGFIHDSEDLSVIYETVTHRTASHRQRSRQVNSRKREIRRILRSLYQKKLKGLTSEEAAILRKFDNPTPEKIRSAINNIRYQRGLRDRYLEGLERSYQYLGEIRQIFEEERVPVDCAYLPHVESSFNYKAYSKVGAAGIWQFMRSTARQFKLKITYAVDERRDPIKTARAAARLLKQNYRRLESWPLALTAYNHGAASMARAIRRVRTRDISAIIENYENRRFGFASKNFYATFVATVEISKEAEAYFPGHNKETPVHASEILLPQPLTIRQIAKATEVPVRVLKKYNLALRPAVFRSSLYVPENFALKLPYTAKADLKGITKVLASLKGKEKGFTAGGTHRVARGENLYDIAKIYRTSLQQLVVLNNIDRPSHIYPGMKLRIPASGKRLASRFKTKPKEIYQVAKSDVKTPEKEETPEPSDSAEEEGEEEEAAESGGETEVVAAEEAKEEAEAAEEAEAEPVTVALEDDTDEEEQEGDASAPKVAVDAHEEETEDDITNATAIADSPAVPSSDVYGPMPAKEDAVAAAVSKKESIVAKPSSELVGVESYDLDLVKLKKKNQYRLVVQPEETLGHYADWAGTSAWKIRRINRMRYGQHIRVGQKLIVSLSADELADFNVKRMEYHLAIQEDFYGAFRVGGVEEYKVKRGDTVDGLVKTYEVPLWLLRKEQDVNTPLRLIAGATVKIPKIVPVSDE